MALAATPARADEKKANFDAFCPNVGPQRFSRQSLLVLFARDALPVTISSGLSSPKQ